MGLGLSKIVNREVVVRGVIICAFLNSGCSSWPLTQAAKESFWRNSVQVGVLIRIRNIRDSVVPRSFALYAVEQKSKQHHQEDSTKCRAESNKHNDADRMTITCDKLVDELGSQVVETYPQIEVFWGYWQQAG